MKKFILLIAIVVLFSSCGVKKGLQENSEEKDIPEYSDYYR